MDKGNLCVSVQDVWEYQDISKDLTKRLVLLSVSSKDQNKVSLRDILTTLDKLDYDVHITRDIVHVHMFVDKETNTYDFLVNFIDMLEIIIEGELTG